MVNNILAAADVWRTIGSVVLAILILLVMITIHEFGHYIAGKIFHFKINEFSIGFGPALFKKKNKKSGEIFAVRLIPLGGYCAFEGEDGLDEEKEEEKKELPEPFADEAEGAAPSVAGKEAGESAQAEPPVVEEKTGPHPDAFTKKPPWQRIIVLVAGALMNYLLALLLIIIGVTAYGQTMVKVNGVASAETAEEAEYSFRAGDVLLQGGGRSFYLTTDVAQAVNGKNKGDIVEFRVAREEGVEIVKIMLREDVRVKNSSDFSGVWKALGVGVEEREDGKYYMLESSVYRFGFWESLGRSFVYSFKIAGSIFQVLGELLTGRLGLSAFGGPVTTITMTSQMVSQGARSFLEISGFIGVNLAVFNLLPIPALDGSKVVFTVIEWIRKKPISRKVEAIIHGVGFLLLLGFAVLVDILQFL